METHAHPVCRCTHRQQDYSMMILFGQSTRIKIPWIPYKNTMFCKEKGKTLRKAYIRAMSVWASEWYKTTREKQAACTGK